MSRAPQSIPAMPAPLSPIAAAMPATCVPWPWSSCAVIVPVTKVVPVINFALRSGWFRSMPVSRMAMVMETAPVVISQACGAWMATGPYC